VDVTTSQDRNCGRTQLLDESRSRQKHNTIYLVALTTPSEELALEIYRSMHIADLHRNDPDQEVREYCTGQLDRAEKIRTEQLIPLIRRALTQGSFIFRGQSTAVTALNQDLLPAATKILSGAADQIFDRYAEAPHRGDT